MNRTIVPPIKIQGIKTKLVPWIKDIAPTNFDGRWIEPFMGSGVVAFNIRPREALLADSNPHLIRFYQAVSQGEITARIARLFLEKEGAELLRTDGEHYYAVRDRFNKDRNPLDFLFLNRSCFNGMIRFNRKGGFNVPFCKKPNRFAKAYVTKICNQIQGVVDALALGDYEFKCQDFSDTIKTANSNDIIYCDPPYIARHTDYFNGWGEEQERILAKLLGSTNARFILSTWHSNKYRNNPYIEELWTDYFMLTREHFYHLGGKEDNRNAMLEALITNFETSYEAKEAPKTKQMEIFAVAAT
ncbi:Dam family site-specific DNA-(adenine-N6)-methyltransferase [bacterium]|nr:Dam family site-specific DNA-(adenine-N6)-methyltransferase [bacterium]